MIRNSISYNMIETLVPHGNNMIDNINLVNISPHLLTFEGHGRLTCWSHMTRNVVVIVIII